MSKLTRMSKVNDYLEALLAEGWRVLRSHKHVVVSSPDGSIKATVAATAKDNSSTAKNALALLKRKRREYMFIADGEAILLEYKAIKCLRQGEDDPRVIASAKAFAMLAVRALARAGRYDEATAVEKKLLDTNFK